MEENMIEVRRFALEATPDYWARFHAWLKSVRPKPTCVTKTTRITKFRHIGEIAA